MGDDQEPRDAERRINKLPASPTRLRSGVVHLGRHALLPPRPRFATFGRNIQRRLDPGDGGSLTRPSHEEGVPLSLESEDATGQGFNVRPAKFSSLVESNGHDAHPFAMFSAQTGSSAAAAFMASTLSGSVSTQCMNDRVSLRRYKANRGACCVAVRSTGVALPPNGLHERGTRISRLGLACRVPASNSNRSGTVKSLLRHFFPSLVRRDCATLSLLPLHPNASLENHWIRPGEDEHCALEGIYQLSFRAPEADSKRNNRRVHLRTAHIDT